MSTKELSLANSLGVIGKHFKKTMSVEVPNNLDHSMKDCRSIEFLSTGKKTMKEISDELNLTPGSTTTHIDKLIENNLAIRIYDENDRRKVYIELSADGKKICNFFKKKHIQISRDILEILDGKDREVYVELSEKIAGELEKK